MKMTHNTSNRVRFQMRSLEEAVSCMCKSLATTGRYLIDFTQQTLPAVLYSELLPRWFKEPHTRSNNMPDALVFDLYPVLKGTAAIALIGFAETYSSPGLSLPGYYLLTDAAYQIADGTLEAGRGNRRRSANLAIDILGMPATYITHLLRSRGCGS